jgi:formylglycine-generating enzyme required for sulfatase activity/uncharacterized caspase-like protein
MSRASSIFMLLVIVCYGIPVLSAQAPPTAAVAPAKPSTRAPRPQQASSQARPQEKRIALVIGNGAYPDAPLKNPVNDSRAMAEVLKTCGFQVIALENAPLQKMREGLREFGGRIAQGGVGLFYFAGHGMQVKGRNYLMPVGADIEAEDEVAGAALDVDSVLAKLETARNRLNILILDACRNDPFARSFRSASQGLAPLDAPMGTFIAFATAPGKTAADGGGSHGLYTEQLLRAIQSPGLKLEDTFKQVLSGVRRASGDRQVPWTASSVEGDFFFKPGPAPVQSLPEANVPLTAMPTGAPAAAFLEGAEAQKAIVKDAFETDAEYATRLSRLPPVRFGTVRLLREKYDLQKQRLPVAVDVESWAACQVWQKLGSLELDRVAAKALCDEGEERPLVARFEATGGRLTMVGAKALGMEDVALVEVLRLGETRQDPASGLEFVLIPAGSFQMGTNAKDPTDIGWLLDNARPVHPVTITQSFMMQKCPVTVAQFRAFVAATAYRTEAERGDGAEVLTGSEWKQRADANWRNPYFTQEDGCPVVCVSWNDAQAYVRWLNSNSVNLTFRLPTEAEWEYACRAGTTGETYGPLDAIAWHTDNSGKRTRPVGQKQANDFGLYDMLGNAWQWCQDRYGYYTTSASEDPQGPASGSYRVSRGGCWGNNATLIRSASRGPRPNDVGASHLGFRVVAMARTQ